MKIQWLHLITFKTRQRIQEHSEYIQSPGDEEIAGMCGDYRWGTDEWAWRKIGDWVNGEKQEMKDIWGRQGQMEPWHTVAQTFSHYIKNTVLFQTLF